MSYEYIVNVKIAREGEGSVALNIYEGTDEAKALCAFTGTGHKEGTTIKLSRRSVEPWEVIQKREIVSMDTITRRKAE